MTYAREISKGIYQETSKDMADHVVLTRSENADRERVMREAVRTADALREQYTEKVHEHKYELSRMVDRLIEDEEVSVEFAEECAVKEFNRQIDILEAKYKEALAAIDDLVERNGLLSYELDMAQNNGSLIPPEMFEN